MSLSWHINNVCVQIKRKCHWYLCYYADQDITRKSNDLIGVSNIIIIIIILWWRWVFSRWSQNKGLTQQYNICQRCWHFLLLLLLLLLLSVETVRVFIRFDIFYYIGILYTFGIRVALHFILCDMKQSLRLRFFINQHIGTG